MFEPSSPQLGDIFPFDCSPPTTKPGSPKPPLIFRNAKFIPEDCLAAIRGERVPEALGSSTSRWCVIHGIRYHPGFATELYGTLPKFTRALNARRIMSDDIPDMKDPEEFPYCIWYPETASEATYRELACRYPHMRYQVGRACAVAGYLDLYQELDILPEVHIAEEARDNGSLAIFDIIMASKTKYAVMNDYDRTVNMDQPRPARLNGDVAVRSMLEVKQYYMEAEGLRSCSYERHSADLFEYDHGYNLRCFDITEDMCVDEEARPFTPNVTQWLYTPLPADLPTPHKDLLIVMAAYYGNIDRYARLRRPMMVKTEFECIVRGIYHNTMFAKWWSLQSLDGLQPFQRSGIKCAINARFIMNNDLSRITKDTDRSDLPENIWFPNIAEGVTYQELVHRRPDMKESVARACIIADYKWLWDTLDVQPSSYLILEARASPNPYYLHDMERKGAQRLGKVDRDWMNWEHITRQQSFEPTSMYLCNNVSLKEVHGDLGSFLYDGVCVNVGQIELRVCVPEDMTEELRMCIKEHHLRKGNGVFLEWVYESLLEPENKETN